MNFDLSAKNHNNQSQHAVKYRPLKLGTVAVCVIHIRSSLRKLTVSPRPTYLNWLPGKVMCCKNILLYRPPHPLSEIWSVKRGSSTAFPVSLKMWKRVIITFLLLFTQVHASLHWPLHILPNMQQFISFWVHYTSTFKAAMVHNLQPGVLC